MEIGNIIIMVILTYYSIYFISLLSAKKRVNVQTTNLTLDKMRENPKKTLQEQKDFINIKYPKRVFKFKFSWKGTGLFIFRLAVFIGFMKLYSMILNYYEITIALWQAILFVLIVPMIFNLLLKKINAQKSDLTVMLRMGGGKNEK